MEAKPVKQKQVPAYPTRRDVLKGAASFVFLGLAGTRVVGDEGTGKGITVAPVFKHGDGRGVAGCVVVSPPVFLSEEEGMQVLREELAKHGVNLKAGSVLKGVRIPRRMLKRERIPNEKGGVDRKESVVENFDLAKPLELDGLDPDKNIAIEFISNNDYLQVGGVMSMSTVQSYKFQDVAKDLASTVKKQGEDHVFFAAFYDPLFKAPLPKPSKDGEEIDWQTVWRERRERGVKESQELLRQQAQDFVAWLKKQKVLS